MLEQGQASTPAECSGSGVDKDGKITKIIYQKKFLFPFLEDKEKIRQVQEFDRGEKIKEIFYHVNGKTIERTEEFDRQGNKVNTTIYFYRKNGTLEQTQEFDRNRKLRKVILYLEDGIRIKIIEEFDDEEKLRKLTVYQENGIGVEEIREFHRNRKLRNATIYRKDGTIKQIQEFDENTKLRKVISYRADGIRIKTIEEFGDKEKLRKLTVYQENGIGVEEIREFDDEGKLRKGTIYRKDGTLEQTQEFDRNRKLRKAILYKEDGIRIKTIQEFDDEGKLRKVISYREDGKTIARTEELDESGNLKRTIIFSRGYDHSKLENDKVNRARWLSVEINPNGSIANIDVGKNIPVSEQVKAVRTVLANSFYDEVQDGIGSISIIGDLFVAFFSTPEERNKLFYFHNQYGESLNDSTSLRERILSLPGTKHEKFVITRIENAAKNHSVLAIVPADKSKKIMIFDSSNVTGDFLNPAGCEILGLKLELAEDTIIINCKLQSRGTCGCWSAFAALYCASLSDEELEELSAPDKEVQKRAAEKLEIGTGKYFLKFMYNMYKRRKARSEELNERLRAMGGPTPASAPAITSSTTSSTSPQGECFAAAAKPEYTTHLKEDLEKELKTLANLFIQETYRSTVVNYTMTYLQAKQARRAKQARIDCVQRSQAQLFA